ncbi:MAG: RecQ family zinc-binding domain-containing protein, partial [Planctomycetales bacterium]|nr:RecQ family zinc-binding domain-containing protein [Planctomycetales bacterium]
LTLQEVKERIGLSISAEGVGTCEQLLEKAGVIERLDTNENMASIRIEHDLPTTVDLLPREAKSQRKVLRALEQIVGDRRGERVYFPLRTLLEKSKLEREPLNRALRELSRQSWIDYVPPFRGRAVHFRERGEPFETLDIDFAKLDERRAAEYAKLEQVIQYASTRRCRQVEILDYFGDPSSQRCGNCDNCFAAGHRQRVTPTTVAVAGGLAEATLCGSSESVARATTIEDQAAIEVVRIALSGVARAKGRVGKLLVAQMLCGSKSSKVKQAGLRSLSTFGLLDYLKQTDVSDLLDALIRAKWIEQTETTKFRPIVRLTDAGAEVMRGKQPLPNWFHLPDSIAEKVIARAAVERAKSARSEPVPAPSPAFSAEEVSSASPEANTSPDASSNDDLGSLPTHYWTWRLLTAGFSVAECRAIQALSVEQVLDNALRAAEEGRTISPEWFLSAGEIATLETLCGHHGGSPTELLDSLPAEIDRQAARVFLAARS